MTPSPRSSCRSSPHKYYDENMLRALLLSEIREYEKAVEETDRLLPYVDNWAVCDILSPKAFKKHEPELPEKIRVWAKAKETYTVRFGIEMLMSHYLDGDFRAEYLDLPAGVHSERITEAQKAYLKTLIVPWAFPRGAEKNPRKAKQSSFHRQPDPAKKRNNV